MCARSDVLEPVEYTGGYTMADRHGPMRTGRFQVEFDGLEVAGWREVSIPASRTEMGEYDEGGDPDQRKKVWGETTFEDLEMERGVQPSDTRVYDWREDIRNGNLDDGLKEVSVILQDEEGQAQLRWEFHDAWIKYYDPPDLEAGADGEVAVERITLGFDSMDRVEE